MKIQLIILTFLATSISEITSLETQVITTNTGKVQGVIEPSAIQGKMVQKFQNIPYAEPPVGKLRFAKPQPKKPWNGTLKNSSMPVACWQMSKVVRFLTEDCLILNIWTPSPQTSNTTVMVWIHGGAFARGYSGLYIGNNFVAGSDVILVTINYRLSALGFLTTGDDRIKGNFGLFDQRLAMKWVKENIAKFGGNPQSITIFGESAGGASVSAHTISKESWPYFDRAIEQSGTMTMRWATASKPAAKVALDLFLKTVNCRNDEKVLECLQNNVTTKDLERLYSSTPFILSNVWFAPYVDGDFLTDQPRKLLENGIVKNGEVILGVTKDEMFLTFGPLLGMTRNISFLTEKFQETLKESLKNSSEAVYNQALKLYQPECIPSFIEALKPTVAFSTDQVYVCPTNIEAKLQSQLYNASDVYLYHYSHSSPMFLSLYPNGTFGFAAHGTDVLLTFGQPFRDSKSTVEDKILSMRMILYWTNFAKNGNPNVGTRKLPVAVNNVDNLPYWPKFTNSSQEFLDMESLSRMIVRKRLREMYCDFWRDPEGFTEQARSATAKQIVQVEKLIFAKETSKRKEAYKPVNLS